MASLEWLVALNAPLRPNWVEPGVGQNPTPPVRYRGQSSDELYEFEYKWILDLSLNTGAALPRHKKMARDHDMTEDWFHGYVIV